MVYNLKVIAERLSSDVVDQINSCLECEGEKRRISAAAMATVIPCVDLSSETVIYLKLLGDAVSITEPL